MLVDFFSANMCGDMVRNLHVIMRLIQTVRLSKKSVGLLAGAGLMITQAMA